MLKDIWNPIISPKKHIMSICEECAKEQRINGDKLSTMLDKTIN